LWWRPGEAVVGEPCGLRAATGRRGLDYVPVAELRFLRGGFCVAVRRDQLRPTAKNLVGLCSISPSWCADNLRASIRCRPGAQCPRRSTPKIAKYGCSRPPRMIFAVARNPTRGRLVPPSARRAKHADRHELPEMKAANLPAPTEARRRRRALPQSAILFSACVVFGGGGGIFPTGLSHGERSRSEWRLAARVFSARLGVLAPELSAASHAAILAGSWPCRSACGFGGPRCRTRDGLMERMLQEQEVKRGKAHVRPSRDIGAWGLYFAMTSIRRCVCRLFSCREA